MLPVFKEPVHGVCLNWTLRIYNFEKQNNTIAGL